MQMWAVGEVRESLRADERGQTAVEYAAVLLIVVTVVTVVAAVQWPAMITGLLDRIISSL